jgi:hypothetical protein
MRRTYEFLRRDYYARRAVVTGRGNHPDLLNEEIGDAV